MQAQEIAIIVAVCTLIGSVVSGITGAASALLVTWLNKKSEERRHYRELVVKTAVEHWGQVADYSRGNIMPPLDDYILHMKQVADLMTDPKLSAENVVEKLKKINAFRDRVIEYRTEDTENLFVKKK
jgi:gas vesicle protein